MIDDALYDYLMVDIQLLSDDGIIKVNITKKDEKYYTPFFVVKDYNFPKPTKMLTDFVEITSNPFSYKIHAEGQPDKVLYESDPTKLMVSKHFVIDKGKFSLDPDNKYPLMGLGQRKGPFYINSSGTHTLFTRASSQYDDGKLPGKNSYGAHPFYAYQTPNKKFMGVFNMNTHAMDYILNFNGGTDTEMTNVMVGGFLWKYYFIGSGVDDVIKKYQSVVGKPFVPPMWSFGWH